MLSPQEVRDRVYYPTNPNTCAHTCEDFLALRSTPLVGSQVDAIVYCCAHDPRSRVFHELGDPETLQGREQQYQFNPGPHPDQWLKDDDFVGK